MAISARERAAYFRGVSYCTCAGPKPQNGVGGEGYSTIGAV